MLPTLLAALAGVALLAGGGAGLAGLLPKAADDGDDPIHGGWCFLAGSALAALLLHLPLAIDGRLPGAAFPALLLLGLVLAAGPGRAHVRRVGAARFFGLDLLGALPGGLRVVALLLVVLALSVSFGPFAGWDERAIYGLKARILQHEGSVRVGAFTDVDQIHSQARYPLAVPLLEAALLAPTGSLDDHGLKLLFVAFGLALALVVAGEARRLGGPRAGALWGLLFLTTPMVIGPGDGHGMTAYADLPFAAFATGAVVLVSRALERHDQRGEALAGLLLGAALAAKQEGAIWALAIGLSGLVVWWRRGGAWTSRVAGAAARVALPALLFLAASVAARRWIPPSSWSESYASVFTPEWLRQLGGRPLEIAPFVLRELSDWKEWAWSWPLVLVGLLALRRPDPGRAALFLRGTALLVLGADIGIFVVTPDQVHWHLATAFARLLLQLLPLALLVLAEQVEASGWRRQAVAAFRGVA